LLFPLLRTEKADPRPQATDMSLHGAKTDG
jgi:hypothetical protein